MSEIIKIKRVCKPGEVNQNGYKYTIDSYNKAMKEFNEKIKYGMHVPFVSSYDSLDNLDFVDVEKSCGIISEVTDDYVSIIPLENNPIIDAIKENIDDFEMCMRYVADTGKYYTHSDGSKVIGDFKITCFDIMCKNHR